MKKFFSHDIGWPIYQRYGWLHFLQIFILLFAVILIFINREKIKKWKYNDKFMRIFMGSFLLYNMFTYYISEIIMGNWTYKEYLPLHLCFIANFLFIYVLFTNNRQKWFRWVYFLTFAGPFPYIIFPDMAIKGQSMLFGPNRFMFYQAFFSHFFLIICSCYCLFIYDWKIKKKDILDTFVISNIIFALVFIFNLIFGTNYIMTKGLPNYIFDILPFLKYINYPILLLEVAGIGAILVAYIPVEIINKKRRNIEK